jgi:hypothetical protein
MDTQLSERRLKQVFFFFLFTMALRFPYNKVGYRVKAVVVARGGSTDAFTA